MFVHVAVRVDVAVMLGSLPHVLVIHVIYPLILLAVVIVPLSRTKVNIVDGLCMPLCVERTTKRHVRGRRSWSDTVMRRGMLRGSSAVKVVPGPLVDVAPDSRHRSIPISVTGMDKERTAL